MHTLAIAGLPLLAAPMVAGAVLGTLLDLARGSKPAPALERYTTTLELYGIAAGALEPLHTIDQDMARRIIGGDVVATSWRTATAVSPTGM